MNWKKRPYWMRGGIIGFVFGCLVAVYFWLVGLGNGMCLGANDLVGFISEPQCIGFFNRMYLAALHFRIPPPGFIIIFTFPSVVVGMLVGWYCGTSRKTHQL